MTTAEAINFSLGLTEDDSPGLEELCRLLQLPCKSVLAYGGDEGHISSLIEKENRFQVIQRCDDQVRAIAFSADGKRVAVGFDTGQIDIYRFDNYELTVGVPHPFAQIRAENKGDDNDLLSQDQTTSHTDLFSGPDFDSPIRDLCFLRNQSDSSFWLAIASESGMRIVNADSNETIKQQILERESQESHGHWGIRGIALNKNSSLMASLSMDGRLCAWSINFNDSETPEVKLLERESKMCIAKKDTGEVHGSDFFDRSCRPLFHDDLLATPGQLLPVIRKIKEKQMENIEVTNCEEDGHVESIMALEFFDKDHFITSGRDKRVIFWRCDCETGVLTPLKTFKLESAVTDFCLRQDHSVYTASASGTCVVLNFATHFQQTKMTNDVQKDVHGKAPKNSNARNDDEDVDFSTNSDGDAVTPKQRVRFLDDEADEDDVSEDKSPRESRSYGLEAGDDGNIMVDDYDDFGNLPKPSMFQPRVSSVVHEIPPQPAFSISSTPLDLSRRFLCWNHVGSITILHGDGDLNHRNTVDINFTDSAYKRPISFTDNMNFILGSVGEDGAIFASDLQEEDDDDDSIQENLDDLQMSERTKQAVKRSHRKRSNPNDNPMGSSIFFYRFETFGTLRDKDWYLKLPDGERVLGSACGQGWAAVMTR
jgi:chromosome transmission fidelity protein 4